MSGTELAARMGVGQSTVSGLEQGEVQGTIRLDTLRRVADALDCDLVYYLSPRRRWRRPCVVRLGARPWRSWRSRG